MGTISLLRTNIVYPDGSEEIIEHYGMYPHSSGGFGFYLTPQREGFPNGVYIFVSGANVRKIIPLKEV